MPVTEVIPNYIGGEWKKSAARESQTVINPATQESFGELPLSGGDDVSRRWMLRPLRFRSGGGRLRKNESSRFSN